MPSPPATRSARSQVVRALVVTTAALLVAWIAAVTTLMAWGQSQSRSGTYDVIIVAGASLEEDGSPSRALQARVEAGVAHLETGSAAQIFFTGGLGETGLSEAEVAAAHAIALGVPADAIAMEEESTSTWENAIRASETLEGSNRVLVISDGYHLFRCQRVFDRFFDEADVAPTRFSLRDLDMATRELAAIAYYAVLGRL